PQPTYLLRFQYERNEFVARELIGNVMNFISDPGTIPFTRISCEVSCDTLLDICRFPDVNNSTSCVVEVIYSGFGWERVKRFFRKIGWKNGFTRISLEASQDIVVFVALKQAIEDPGRCCLVTTGTMAVSDFDAEAFCKSAETVRTQAGNNPPT